MCYKNEILYPKMVNGKVFDFFPKSGHPMIMSYSYLERDLFINDKKEELILGDIKKRKEIRSIYELRQVFEELVECELEMVNRDGTYNVGIDLENSILTRAEIKSLPFHVIIRSEDRDFFMNQLIFDVLFSKYVVENPRMTLRQYSLSHANYIWDGLTESNSKVESVRKSLANALKKQISIMNNPELRNQIEKLGVNPDEFFAWMNQVSSPFLNGKKQEIHEKPKVFWDYMYYNACAKLITGKQYARSFIKNGNYSRAAFVELFDTYDRFVDEVFMGKIEKSKDYFLKSMGFYYLEIYKRLDFIYKLAVRLENKDLPVINKNHPLVKRFHPCICDVFVEEGILKFGSKNKYYGPMLLLEEFWQREELYNDPVYEDMLTKYHFIRAKIYELFKYHFQFVSDDYDDISDFIDKHYDILHYHQSQKIWIQADKKRKIDREARIIRALEINKALFGDVYN